MGFRGIITWCLAFFLFMEFMGLAKARNFFVGGKDGWVLNASESFDHWSQRNRFQVNDTLVFKYKLLQGSESILVVSNEDYYSCNTKSPITSLSNGESVFLLDHSGPFFFIDGIVENCRNGLKLHLVVMAVRKPRVVPSSSPSQSPVSSESPLPEQRVDPSALDDAPSPASWKDHSGSVKGFDGSGLGFVSVSLVILLGSLGLV